MLTFCYLYDISSLIDVRRGESEAAAAPLWPGPGSQLLVVEIQTLVNSVIRVGPGVGVEGSLLVY